MNGKTLIGAFFMALLATLPAACRNNGASTASEALSSNLAVNWSWVGADLRIVSAQVGPTLKFESAQVSSPSGVAGQYQGGAAAVFFNERPEVELRAVFIDSTGGKKHSCVYKIAGVAFFAAAGGRAQNGQCESSDLTEGTGSGTQSVTTGTANTTTGTANTTTGTANTTTGTANTTTGTANTTTGTANTATGSVGNESGG